MRPPHSSNQTHPKITMTSSHSKKCYCCL